MLSSKPDQAEFTVLVSSGEGPVSISCSATFASKLETAFTFNSTRQCQGTRKITTNAQEVLASNAVVITKGEVKMI